LSLCRHCELFMETRGNPKIKLAGELFSWIYSLLSADL